MREREKKGEREVERLQVVADGFGKEVIGVTLFHGLIFMVS